MDFQNLTRDDVWTEFEHLLVSNGQATSLEVKNALRQKGFWATQAVVGSTMQDLAEEHGVRSSFNGNYLVYSLTANPAAMAPASTPQPVKRAPLDPADRVPLTSAVPGDWAVYDASDPSKVLYFKGTMTEGQAKYSFSSEMGTQYVNARAKRTV